ncbi:MAG: hypothetical protein DI607_01420 [Sphingomonas hengshuiensis]|nr:MAG: hypothetical protein DI607_01420 [Sphingomonas hengshuiensis]
MPHPLPPTFDGFGLGMRPPHYGEFLAGDVDVDFVEVISENFMVAGGRPLHVLDRVRERYPVALHGVSMSIGRATGLDGEYLARLKKLADRVKPLWVSDHLCWTGIAGFNTHDLLPVPLTEEALDVVCANIAQAQDVLERALIVENPSSYVTFADDQLTEWAFMAEMASRTGCGLLLDVNNIYVSATNHGFSAMDYLDAIPADRVRQIHLAGHSAGQTLLIDTHDAPVPDPVWALYVEASRRVGPVATMIERDDDIPPLAVLLDELRVARDLKARGPGARELMAVA